MYLAAIADSQPQPPTMPGQVHNITLLSFASKFTESNYFSTFI